MAVATVEADLARMDRVAEGDRLRRRDPDTPGSVGSREGEARRGTDDDDAGTQDQRDAQAPVGIGREELRHAGPLRVREAERGGMAPGWRVATTKQ